MATLTTVLPQAATAQDHSPIEWVVGYGAGGGSDMVARMLAAAIAESLSRPVNVTNRPGAASTLAADYVMKHASAGTVVFTGDLATLATNTALYPKLHYDPERDFAAVTMLAKFPFVLVVPSDNPARTFQEFVAWVKGNQGRVTYASVGAGSPHHLATELLIARTGLVIKPVHYRGGAAAMKDVVAGQVSFALMDSWAIQESVTAGKVRALGVASPVRLPGMPQLPTLEEQGLRDFDVFAWQGLVVPRDTPAETVAAIGRAVASALDSPMVKAKLLAALIEPMPGTPEEMNVFLRSERERWVGLIQRNHIVID